MRKIKWGILSTAEIARIQYIPAIQQSSNGTVLAIASGSGKAVELAKEFNIPKAYQSYEELLDDEEIEIVYIPLPNALHSEWVKKSAEKGKHVLVEKPSALTAKETAEMIEICDKHNVFYMEAIMYPFHPQFQRVKEIIDSGEIGTVKLMRSSFRFPLEQVDGNIRMSPALGGGSLYDVGCYSIHAIRNILGEPTRVYSTANMQKDYNVDMNVVAILEFENNRKAYFDCSMDMALKDDYEIVGTEGTIIVPKAFNPREDWEGIVKVISNSGEEREEKYYGKFYTLGVEYISSILTKKELWQAKRTDSINNMKIIDACFLSQKTKQVVKIN